MRIDLYIKTLLTLIVLFLAMIALKPVFQPPAAMAAGNFGSIQFSYSSGEPAFFNTQTGDVWLHDNNGHFRQHYKVNTFGRDLDR